MPKTKKPKHKETLTVTVTVDVSEDQAVESKCRMLLQWASVYDKDFKWSKSREILKI